MHIGAGGIAYAAPATLHWPVHWHKRRYVWPFQVGVQLVLGYYERDCDTNLLCMLC